MKKYILIAVCTFIIQIVSADVLIKNGESIAFLGDSITQFGARNESGYAREVISGLKANGIEVKPYYAGISGHKSNQMLARLNKDVISKNPDWMTLSCGVNDVWHGKRGVPLPAYKTNITAIVKQAKNAGINVMILTSTMIYENENNDQNKKLDKYNDALKKIAAEHNCILVDLNSTMKELVRKANEAGLKTNGQLLTVDGVHMNEEGNMMMAKGILKGFGLNDDMIKKAENHWLNIPKSNEIRISYPKLSIAETRKLKQIAQEQGLTLSQMLNSELYKNIQILLKNKAE